MNSVFTSAAYQASTPSRTSCGLPYETLRGAALMRLGRILGPAAADHRGRPGALPELGSVANFRPLPVAVAPSLPPVTVKQGAKLGRPLAQARSRAACPLTAPAPTLGFRLPRSSEVSPRCSRRPSCCSCRRFGFPLQPETLIFGILPAAADIDTVAIVGICIHVHDVAVLGSAHEPMRRYRPKILPQLSGIRGTHVKPRRHEHLLRISLDHRACRTEEHRYGKEQGFGQGREVLLQLALDRTC